MLEIVSVVMKEALKTANDKLAEAKGFKANSVQRCQSYLEAASAVINGLEDEHDDILSEAKSCDPDKVIEMKHLYTRLDTYLYKDHLRHLLKQSIKGLTPYQNVLKIDADHSWPWRNQDRNQALASFESLLQDLLKYFYELDKYLKGPSGVDFPSLQIIEEHLKRQLGKGVPDRSGKTVFDLPTLLDEAYKSLQLTDPASQKAYFLFEYANKKQQERSTERRMQLVGDIQSTIENLRLEFT